MVHTIRVVLLYEEHGIGSPVYCSQVSDRKGESLVASGRERKLRLRSFAGELSWKDQAGFDAPGMRALVLNPELNKAVVLDRQRVGSGYELRSPVLPYAESGARKCAEGMTVCILKMDQHGEREVAGQGRIERFAEMEFPGFAGSDAGSNLRSESLPQHLSVGPDLMGGFIAAVRHDQDDIDLFIVGQGKRFGRDAYGAGKRRRAVSSKQ